MTRQQNAQLRRELAPAIVSFIEKRFEAWWENGQPTVDDPRRSLGMEPNITVSRLRDRLAFRPATHGTPNGFLGLTEDQRYRQVKTTLNKLVEQNELQTKHAYVRGKRAECFRPSKRWFDEHESAVRETAREALTRLMTELDSLSFD